MPLTTHRHHAEAVVPAHQLTPGDVITWRDGTTTTVRHAHDDGTRAVRLTLGNGRHQSTHRARRFALLHRAEPTT